MIRNFIFLFFCATALVWGGCSKDDGEGILTSPDAIVGKWQLVRATEHYKEDGRWYNDIEYDLETQSEGMLYFEIYGSDGIARYEKYLDGVYSSGIRDEYHYENGNIYYIGFDATSEVTVLTATKLVYRDYFSEEGEYDESIMKRVE